MLLPACAQGDFPGIGVIHRVAGVTQCAPQPVGKGLIVFDYEYSHPNALIALSVQHITPGKATARGAS